MRPKPKNGGDDPRAHWSELHRRPGVPIRFASQGAPLNRGRAPEREPQFRAFVARDVPRATEEQTNNATRLLNPNPGGVRTRSTRVRREDGSISQVINIGVPEDHPLADRNNQVGDSGLYNIRMGPIPVPPAPQFVINYRRNAQG